MDLKYLFFASGTFLLTQCSSGAQTTDSGITDVLAPDMTVADTSPESAVDVLRDVLLDVDPFVACTRFTAQATIAPAAMAIILDASASMQVGGKWQAAKTATIQAIDNPIFNTVSLGLLTFPTGFNTPPMCICTSLGLDRPSCDAALAPGVSCGVMPTLQIPLALAGSSLSSDSTGVRHDIRQFLTPLQPLSNSDDGSPIYDALSSTYTQLRNYNTDRRIAVLITDGGFSCTSISSPQRSGYADTFSCLDWEYPDAVNALITTARTDATKPIQTFIIGVPGSNSNGQPLGGFDTPPYSMRLALSTYAVSGSPETVPANCDRAAVFSQSGSDPANPCHIDLSASTDFSSDTLASAVQSLRGTALGCVYDLPPPPAGEVIDPALVNVRLTVNGTTTVLHRRINPNEMCDTTGCWEFDREGRISIIGQTCSLLTNAQSSSVSIIVGCGPQ